MTDEKDKLTNSSQPEKPADSDGLRYNLVLLSAVTVVAIVILTFVLFLLNKQ